MLTSCLEQSIVLRLRKKQVSFSSPDTQKVSSQQHVQVDSTLARNFFYKDLGTFLGSLS